MWLSGELANCGFQNNQHFQQFFSALSWLPVVIELLPEYPVKSPDLQQENGQPLYVAVMEGMIKE